MHRERARKGRVRKRRVRRDKVHNNTSYFETFNIDVNIDKPIPPGGVFSGIALLDNRIFDGFSFTS